MYVHPRTFHAASVVLAAGLVLCGCPRRFDPAAAPALTSPDEGVNERYTEARRLFDDGKLERAARAFAELARAHPGDPLAAAANLYRGRIALRQGQPGDAKALLAPVARGPESDAVATQARYHLGLALVRLGEHREGRRLLQPFLQRVGDKDRPALLASLGQAARELGDPAAAATYLDELHHATSRPVERLFARSTLEAILGVLPAAKLRAIYSGARPSGLLAALAGQRLARAEAAAGNAAEAARILAATADAREQHRVRSPASGGPAVRPKLVGLLVPLTGRYRSAGREVLRGAVEASSALRDGALSLAIRDSGKSPAAAARELIGEGAVALCGTLDPRATRAVAAVASAAGVPFVALSRVQPTGGAAPPMQMLPENQTRAGALAGRAVRSGAKRLATLAPDTPYGRAMVSAFEARARALGARVVARLTYPAKTAAFDKQAAKLARAPRFEALFVPDQAHTFSLVAPALAKAGLWSATRPATRAKRRQIVLLSTADGLTARLVNASRYVQGAVLAPGFFPDESAPLVRRYRDSQGSPPSLVAALAFDAVELVRAARARGARSRSEIQAALVGGKPVPGLTGAIRFDSRGQRVDPPLLYRVEGEQIRLIGAPAARPVRTTLDPRAR
jgi:ABC-type branched-subunit amino acid transport system substrate-binding protein